MPFRGLSWTGVRFSAPPPDYVQGLVVYGQSFFICLNDLLAMTRRMVCGKTSIHTKVLLYECVRCQSMKKKTALVLEGGAFRGQFTAGVIDVFLEHGITFDACYGVSAGSLIGANYKAKQIGRPNRVNLALRDDKRYMSFNNLTGTGNLIGYDFLFNDVDDKIDPFDNETFNSNPMPLYAVVSDIVFGTADYIKVEDSHFDMDAIRASTALPLLSQPVEIGGHKYLDGGFTDAVPIEHVLEQAGFDQAVVVLTRERGFVKKPYEFMSPAKQVYADYPFFVEALANRHERYNLQREHIYAYEKEGRALIVEPQKPVELGQFDRDGSKLLDLYIQGRQHATHLLEDIEKFIA